MSEVSTFLKANQSYAASFAKGHLPMLTFTDTPERAGGTRAGPLRQEVRDELGAETDTGPGDHPAPARTAYPVASFRR